MLKLHLPLLFLVSLAILAPTSIETAKITKKLSETQDNLKNLEANHQMKNKSEYERLEKLKKEVSQSIKTKETLDNSQFLMIQKLKNENEHLQVRIEQLLNSQDFSKVLKELESVKTDTKIKSEHYGLERAPVLIEILIFS